MTVREANKYDKFFGMEWSQLLASFLDSIEYKRIGAELMRQKKDGIDITPDFDKMFRAFKECPMHKLHTVILGQDVYPTRNKDKTSVADGIAFSAKDNSDPPPSLNKILEAIDTSVYEGEYTWTSVYNQERMEATWDLKPWSNSGILLVNCAYSTIVNTPGAHIAIWRPFTQFLMNTLNERKDALGFILMGTEARSYAKVLTNSTFGVFECEHPAAACYKRRSWQHQGVFKSVTDFHKKQNNITINW